MLFVLVRRPSGRPAAVAVLPAGCRRLRLGWPASQPTNIHQLPASPPTAVQPAQQPVCQLAGLPASQVIARPACRYFLQSLKQFIDVGSHRKQSDHTISSMHDESAYLPCDWLLIFSENFKRKWLYLVLIHSVFSFFLFFGRDCY